MNLILINDEFGFKISSQLKLFKQINNISQTLDHKNPENVAKCKYYDLEEVQSMKIPGNNFLFLSQINICFLNKTFEDLEFLIESTNINFDIIATSATRILRDTGTVKNKNIPNLSFEFTPTESIPRRTSLYIADHLTYQN